MATIASLIVQIAADTSALVTNIDQTNAKLDEFGTHAVSTIAEGSAIGDMFASLAERILDSAVEAVKAFGEEVVNLTLQGSHVNDVAAAFDHLTASAGLVASTLLETLHDGTHGTIDDFALMKQVNQDLAAGLNLTNDQFGLIAQASFALAKVTGGDEASAFNTINSALETGRVRSLALLTGKIDLKNVEQQYADSISSTVQDMTAEQKLEADRQGILNALQSALGRVGDQQDSLADKVQQGATFWANFEDELGQTLATSPVLNAALTTLGNTFIAAFGGDKEAAIKAIVSVVNQLAIYVVDLGIAGTQAATVLVAAWGLIDTAILAVETGVVGLAAEFSHLLDWAAQIATKIPGIGDQFKSVAAATADTRVVLDAMTASLASQTEQAAKMVTGTSQLNATIDKAGGVLLQTRDAMVAASTATDTATKAVQAHNVVQQQTGAVLKDNAQIIALVTKLWDDYATTIAKQTGSALDQQIAAVNKWYDTEYSAIAKLAEKHADAWQALDALNAAYFARLESALVSFDQINANSAQSWKNNLDSVATKAAATYQYMLDHAESFRADTIAKFKDIADQAATAADDWYSSWTQHLDSTSAQLTQIDQQAQATTAAIQQTTIALQGGSNPGASAALAQVNQQVFGAFGSTGFSTTQYNLLEQEVQAKMAALGYSATAISSPAVRSFDVGGPVYGDGPAMLHDQEYVVPKGGALVSGSGTGGAGGALVVNISGVWDLRSADQAAQAIGKALLRRTGRQFGSAH